MHLIYLYHSPCKPYCSTIFFFEFNIVIVANLFIAPAGKWNLHSLASRSCIQRVQNQQHRVQHAYLCRSTEDKND